MNTDDRVLIDYRTSDDAGVYRVEGGPALVQTVDFFTPIVDDPFVYGQIAAANALSDVYAMGGRPVTALAIAGFPAEVDRAILRAILAGGLAKLHEAQVALLGGHTVQDHEIKFGYAVTGHVDPGRVWSNAGARAGDRLILTKALGTGIIATALKFGRASTAAVDAAVQSMLSLNRAASEALRSLTADAVHACTDVTGFGLLGHAVEMAMASGCTFRIEAQRVPLLAGARELVKGNIPGGGRNNAKHFGPAVRLGNEVPTEVAELLHDPQTSGGLLVAVAPHALDDALAALSRAGVTADVIGEVAAVADVRVIVA